MKLSQCRICDSKELIPFLDLGHSPLANALLTKEQVDEPETYYPLKLIVCKKCKFIQLSYIIDPEKLFSNYFYFSSMSKTSEKHYAELALEASSLTNSKEPFIVEIASNDGVLLKNYKNTNVRFLGIDPAKNIAEQANKNGIPTLPILFNKKTATQIQKEHGKADVILGTNVFAHVPDLHDFVEGLSTLLADDGIAIFESPHAIDFIQKNEFDTTYHEHCSYLALQPLTILFDDHDFELFDAKRTQIHGGSIRFYIKKKKDKRKISNNVKKILQMEKEALLDDLETYFAFGKHAQELRNKLLAIIIKIKLEGKTIAAYGAAAKGNTLLNYLGLENGCIEFIADNIPAKIGKYSPGRNIEIVHESEIIKRKPDYLLILPWNFAAELMEKQKEYKKAGGKFIIGIPEPRIV